MPFTGSHVAAVLPLGGTALPVSALVVGSMAPDIPYYVPEGPWMLVAGGGATHSLLGVLVVAPCWGLLVLMLWHTILGPASVAFSPEPLRRRLPSPATPRDRFGSPGALALTVLALMVGAATHVLWDAFTHDDRWGAENVSWLSAPVTWLPRNLPGYQWAQYASGVLGGLAILVWVTRWWRRTPPIAAGVADVGPRTRVAALTAVVGAAAVGGIVVVVRAGVGTAPVHLDALGFAVATRAAMTGAAVALVLAAAWAATRRGHAR